MKHECKQEENINKFSRTLYGTNGEKGIKARLDLIDQKLSQQPTSRGLILTGLGLVGTLITGLAFIFNFLLNNQAATLKAETKLIVNNAIHSLSFIKAVSNEISIQVGKKDDCY